MALTKTTLYKIGGAEPGLWIYNTADLATAVIASGYFNNATNELKNGDVILVVTDDPQVGAITVTSATGAATVTTAGTALVLA